VSRILLAEGHGPTREFVAQRLAGVGFEVLSAESPEHAYELYASQRPVAVVLAADFAWPAGAALARRLREVDPRVLVVAIDKVHLGRARGLAAVIPMKANAYVGDPTARELVEKVQHLVSQRGAAQGGPGRAALRGAALVLSRAPSERGELRPGLVARLLHQLWRAFSEGILVLDEGGRERRLFVLRGTVVAFASGDPAESLVGWLAASGRIEAGARAAALESMAGGLSAGGALIAAGVVEPGEPLRAAMREHLQAMVVRAVGAREGRWRFHPGAEFAPEVHGVEILPLQAILAGAREGIPLRHLAEALREVMDAHPARTPEFQRLVPAAALSSQDLRLALSLDGRATARAWLDGHQRELKDALALLWFLSLVGAVAFHEEPAAPDAYGSAGAAPRRRKPLPPDRAEALRQAALQILPGTYFHALGLDIGADGPEVEAAYQEVASRFHPDGFAELDVGDLADLLAAVQDKLTAAYRVLSSDERRRGYLAYLLQRVEPGGVRREQIDLDAEVLLKRGERALLARRNVDAVAALSAAAQRSPREPEYHAMLGFAELFDPLLPPAQRAAEARRHARRALQLAPGHARATAVLALAERLAGDLPEARRVVLAGLEAHPASEVLKAVLHRLSTPGA
jgi:hypothetical protein